MAKAMEHCYIGAVDQGTASTRFILFNRDGTVMASHQMEHTQLYPAPGWADHDPKEILRNVIHCIDAAVDKAIEKGIKPEHVKAVGLTNQRETTIAWNRTTGEPLSNALVWLDARTAGICHEMSDGAGGKNRFRESCGLPLATYFSAPKIRWLLDNVPAVQAAVKEGRCVFGTMDTWLIWNLTGGVEGGALVTDVTNASRTMLMDLQTLQWHEPTCTAFGISSTTLPTITSSSEVYGHLTVSSLKGVPLSGCLGDQQAALVGLKCFHPGQAKNTYGTGCFVLQNTGLHPMPSKHGLLTTVGYKLGRDQPVHYALEGSIAMAGAIIRWLRDNLQMIKTAAESETLAEGVSNTAGVYFVPAFSGLFAPHWRDDARGVIVGLTLAARREHIVRATLEAVCFQTREVLEAMSKDSGVHPHSLRVDGGMTANKLLLRLQADLLGLSILRHDMAETTALGAAFAAGLAVGVYASLEDIEALHESRIQTFEPCVSQEDREKRYSLWKMAVERTLGWAT